MSVFNVKSFTDKTDLNVNVQVVGGIEATNYLPVTGGVVNGDVMINGRLIFNNGDQTEAFTNQKSSGISSVLDKVFFMTSNSTSTSFSNAKQGSF